MRQNKRFAFDFIDTLTGNGLDAMHWRTVPDRERGKGRNYDGTIKEVWDELCRDNDEGRGIFAIANKADGHNDASVTGYRAFFVDEDKGRFPNYKVEPSFLVHTARGHHAYWFCTEGTSQEDWVNCQWSMIQALGTDDSIFNPSRIMRVPGFFHCKEEPTMVTMEVLHDRSLRWSSEVFLGLMDIPLVPREKKAPRVKPEAVEIDSEQTVSRAQAYIGAVPYPAEGERNPEIYKMAAKFKDMGLSKDEAFAVIDRWGADQRHALDDDELSCVVDNAYRYGENEPGCDVRAEPKDSSDVGLARCFIESIGPIAHYGGLFYHYVDGVWVAKNSDETTGDVVSTFGEQINSTHKAQAVTRMVRFLSADPRFFVDKPQGVAFLDKFVRVTKHGIVVEEYTPEHKVRHRLGFDYDADATCPQFDEFMGSLFEGDEDAAEKIACLFGYVGACLAGFGASLQKVLLLYGTGANGKGSLCNVIQQLFLRETVSNLAPSDMKGFSMSTLDGILVNIVNELPVKRLEETSAFKLVTSGTDYIQAQVKRENDIFFKPVCGHVFSANRLPSVDDDSEGFWRRWAVIKFNRNFQKEGIALSPDKLFDKLRPELSGIMNRFLLGAVSAAQTDGEFKGPPSSEELREDWRDANCGVRRWVKQRCVPDPEGYTEHKYAHQQYVNWCEQNDVMSANKGEFEMKLAELDYKMVRTRRGESRKRVYRFKVLTNAEVEAKETWGV